MSGKLLNLPATTEETERWLTPRWLLDALGDFDLDPCGAPGWATAETVWTPEDGIDGLARDWFGRVWMNPPYGIKSARWLDALDHHGNGLALIFARTDTRAFHDHVWTRAHGVLFIKGRLTFLAPDQSDPVANSGAPSCLVAYGEAEAERLQEVSIDGHYVPLAPVPLAQERLA